MLVACGSRRNEIVGVLGITLARQTWPAGIHFAFLSRFNCLIYKFSLHFGINQQTKTRNKLDGNVINLTDCDREKGAYFTVCQSLKINYNCLWLGEYFCLKSLISELLHYEIIKKILSISVQHTNLSLSSFFVSIFVSYIDLSLSNSTRSFETVPNVHFVSV